jgi:hypothetical protein
MPVFFVCKTRAPDSLENGAGYLATSGAFSKCPLSCGAGVFFGFFAKILLTVDWWTRLPRGKARGGQWPTSPLKNRGTLSRCQYIPHVPQRHVLRVSDCSTPNAALTHCCISANLVRGCISEYTPTIQVSLQVNIQVVGSCSRLPRAA